MNPLIEKELEELEKDYPGIWDMCNRNGCSLYDAISQSLTNVLEKQKEERRLPRKIMLNKTQLKLLEVLKTKWEQYPEQRFGQFLFNYSRIGTRVELGMVKDPFWYQDSEIIEDLKSS